MKVVELFPGKECRSCKHCILKTKETGNVITVTCRSEAKYPCKLKSKEDPEYYPGQIEMSCIDPENSPDAVKPVVSEAHRYSSGRMSRRRAWCGSCGIGINMDARFCDHCGKPVKWNG